MLEATVKTLDGQNMIEHHELTDRLLTEIATCDLMDSLVDKDKFCIMQGPPLMVVCTYDLPLTASCVSSLPGFGSGARHVGNLPLN